MIYLDHNATTCIHPQVKEIMAHLTEDPLNASSIHTYGRKAKNIIENSRHKIKSLINIKDESRDYDYRVIFTSSGTEANNLVLSNFHDADIFVSAIEHSSILFISTQASNIKIIKVDNKGLVDLEHLNDLLSKSSNNKKLISVMLANNETGIIQPLKEVVTVANKFNAIVHSDIVQALGKIDVDIIDLGIDLATISAHKFGGPLGAGALIAKSKLSIKAQIFGGGQEQGARSGTENVSAIAGVGLAAEIVKGELKNRMKKMQELQIRLEHGLVKIVKVIGDDVLRLPNTSLITSSNSLDTMTQLIALDLKGFAVSPGSACSSGKFSKSHVLEAMNLSGDEIKSAIRVSTSYTNTNIEIDYFIEAFKQINNI